MKISLPFLLPVILPLLGSTVIAAVTPEDRLIIAAMRLSEVPNYSWTSFVSDDAREYTIEGRTDARGFTWMRLPMVTSVAKRLGRAAETDFEAVFHDSGAYVLRTSQGWRTWDELPKRHPDWRDPRDDWGYVPTFQGPFGPRYMIPPPMQSRPKERYSNAQFALSRPHDELSIIVSSHTQLTFDGSVAEGVLSDLGAQLLLVKDGQTHIEPLRAAGVFRLEVNNGIVTRYHLELAGQLRVDGKRVNVIQTSTTQVSGIGETNVAVPLEAYRKLGGR